MHSPETVYGLNVAEITVGLPALVVSAPPLIFPSTPEHTNAWRDIDLPGLKNFFDHSGNCVNGALSAAAILYIGTLLEEYVPERRKSVVIISASVAAAAGSVGINTAYEAGIHVPPYSTKPSEAPFDTADALFGGITGVLFSTVFCISALRRRARTKAKTP